MNHNRLKYYILNLFLCLGILTGCQNKPLTTYRIVVKDKTVTVEIAVTEESKTRGLMWRKSLSSDSGMLFIYPAEQPLHFWMKNTYIPLSIAFIKSDGTITQITSMQPLTEEITSSSERVQYALEMNRGWFERNNIQRGDKVFFPAEIKNIRIE